MPGYRGEGGAVGSLSLRKMSRRCIFELPSFHVLFDLQFNCAPTEVNYVQLFLAGRWIFLASEAWVSGLALRWRVVWFLMGLVDPAAFSRRNAELPRSSQVGSCAASIRCLVMHSSTTIQRSRQRPIDYRCLSPAAVSLLHRNERPEGLYRAPWNRR